MSRFEEKTLPAIRDAQDYTRLIPAGETVSIPVVGDFIYCKQSDVEIPVIVNGKTIRMEAGDKRKSAGEIFDNVTLRNDTENPIICTFVIGFGDYDRVIVRGEITAELKLRTANGDYIDDTRKKLSLDVNQVPGSGFTETQGQFIRYFYENGSPDWLYTVDGGARTFENPSAFTYTDTNNDGIIVLGQTPTGPNDYWAIEVDPVSGALIRDLGEIADLGQPESVARLGNVLYQRNSFGTKGIYKKAPGGSWEFVVSNGSSNPSFCVDSNGNIYVASNSSVVKYDPSGNSVTSYSATYYVQSLSIFQGKLYVYHSANYRPHVLDLDLNLITRPPNTQSTNSAVVYGNYLFDLFGGSPTDRIRVEAIETVVDLFAGNASLACENSWLGPKPDEFTAVRSDAAISVSNASSGNPTVSGELIRLILEWYKGEPVGDDYLDFIFGIEIYGSADSDGITFPPTIIQSQGQTFLAAGIVDNLTQIFPVSARITIDNRLGV